MLLIDKILFESTYRDLKNLFFVDHITHSKKGV